MVDDDQDGQGYAEVVESVETAWALQCRGRLEPPLGEQLQCRLTQPRPPRQITLRHRTMPGSVTSKVLTSVLGW